MGFPLGNVVNTQGQGGVSTSLLFPTFKTRNPTSTDANYSIPQQWINTSTSQNWYLYSFTTTSGVTTANWLEVGYGGTAVLTLTGNSGGALYPTSGNINILGTGSVTVSGSSSTLTISVDDQGLTWNSISASQTLAVNNGYFCTSGSTLSLALPATSALGDTIIVSLSGSTGFTISQSAGQSISIANTSSTAGVSGSVSSTQQGDTLTLVCKTANLTWVAIESTGNLTIV